MGTSHADALPLGSRLQLNLAYDTAQLPNPFARAIARCLQTHGAWVGDYASAPAFLAEDSSKGVGAEWGWERSWRLTYWDSEYPDASSGQPGFLHPARFPWAELRVLDAPLRTRPYGP